MSSTDSFRTDSEFRDDCNGKSDDVKPTTLLVPGFGGVDNRSTGFTNQASL